MREKLIKIFIYIIFIIILVKILDIFFISKTIPTSSNDEVIEKIKYKEFDYGDYKTVKLLHTDTRRSRRITA